MSEDDLRSSGGSVCRGQPAQLAQAEASAADNLRSSGGSICRGQPAQLAQAEASAADNLRSSGGSICRGQPAQIRRKRLPRTTCAAQAEASAADNLRSSGGSVCRGQPAQLRPKRLPRTTCADQAEASATDNLRSSGGSICPGQEKQKFTTSQDISIMHIKHLESIKQKKETTMNKTIRLYDENAYNTEFNACVISCRASEKRKDHFEVILDRTLFFPEEGGQSPDKGTINGAEVIDVQIRDEVITHFTKTPFEEGSLVQGQINWEHRYANMQQHSGEHLFSGLAHTSYGCTNVGFHLSDHEVTLDLDRALTEEEISHLEEQVNEKIAANIESRIIYPSKEEEKNYDYRSKIEIEGQTRLVEYPGVDLCACCAPHVARTSEIGILKVMSWKNYKGGVRVSILCGSRAFKALRDEHEVLQKTARFLSAKPLEVYELTEGMKAEIGDLKNKIRELGFKNLQTALAGVDPDAADVLIFTEDADMKNVRDLLNDLCTRHTGVCAVFVGSLDKYRFIMGSSTGKASERLNAMKERVTIRGGGRPEMAEGSCQAEEDAIRKAFEG